MKISLAQINPTVGDIKANYKLIVKHAKIALGKNSEILITPELSICGYPPEDLLLNNDFVVYEPIENFHVNQMLSRSIIPADINKGIIEKASYLYSDLQELSIDK